MSIPQMPLSLRQHIAQLTAARAAGDRTVNKQLVDAYRAGEAWFRGQRGEWGFTNRRRRAGAVAALVRFYGSDMPAAIAADLAANYRKALSDTKRQDLGASDEQ